MQSPQDTFTGKRLIVLNKILFYPECLEFRRFIDFGKVPPLILITFGSIRMTSGISKDLNKNGINDSSNL